MGELYRLDFMNGKAYIGITTTTAASRYKGHCRSVAANRTTTLCRAWRKHGAPVLRVLAVIENEMLATTEIAAIKAFQTITPYGYNMLEGGQVSPMTSPYVRAKVAATLTGKKRTFSAEHRRNLWANRRVKTCSDEQRAAISASMKGRKLSAEHVAKLKGRKHSTQHKENIAAGLKGKKHSAERIAKITAFHKGRKRSAESKAKMSASHKGVKWSAARKSASVHA